MIAARPNRVAPLNFQILQDKILPFLLGHLILAGGPFNHRLALRRHTLPVATDQVVPIG